MRIRILLALFLVLLGGAVVDGSAQTTPSAKTTEPAYVVFNYEISDRDAYEPYLMQVPETLEAFGAEVVVADFESDAIEGAAGGVTVVLKFASRETALDWYRSPQYQKIIELRTANSSGIASLAGAAEN